MQESNEEKFEYKYKPLEKCPHCKADIKGIIPHYTDYSCETWRYLYTCPKCSATITKEILQYGTIRISYSMPLDHREIDFKVNHPFLSRISDWMRGKQKQKDKRVK